jgi:hypothetical protein
MARDGRLGLHQRPAAMPTAMWPRLAMTGRLDQPARAQTRRGGLRLDQAVGNFRKIRFIGLGANQIVAYVLASAYNLLRIAKLAAVP